MKVDILFCALALCLSGSLVAQDEVKPTAKQEEQAVKGRGENRKGMAHRHSFSQIPMMTRQELLPHIDENHDGIIDDEEFGNALQLIFQRIAKGMEDYRQYYHAMILKRFDKNKDGKLDAEERAHVQCIFDEVERHNRADGKRHTHNVQSSPQPSQEELNRILEKCKNDMNSLSRHERWVMMQALRQSDRGGNRMHREEGRKRNEKMSDHQKGNNE